ncbi:MAG: haloalkane dehalogenase [Pseudomonadota bacterium]
MTISRRTLLSTAAAMPAATLASELAAQTSEQESSSPFGLPISADFPFAKKRANVLNSEITYVDEGDGTPIVFLHGNPTSSYLWRNIIPYATAAGYRVIAPDLIGMGDSGKPDIDYTFADHAAYLDAFLDGLALDPAVFVIHDWGSALGMRYARRTPEKVKGLVYLEAIVPPAMPFPSFDAMPPVLADFFRLMRTDEGAELILGQNMFVEQVLPDLGVMRPMQGAEMEAYRAPFPTRDSRKPTLVWPRQVPIGGTPEDVVDDVTRNGTWLTETSIPKLLFYATPGALMPQQVVDWHAANVSNLEIRYLGAGLHFLQEDHPDLIGQGLADWLRRTSL